MSRSQRKGPMSDSSMRITTLASIYQKWADQHYRKPSGRPTREATNVMYALRHLVLCHGRRSLDRLDAEDVKAVRQSMIEAKLARTTVNARMGRCRRFVRWAIENTYARPTTIVVWQSLSPLQYGRSDAHETPPVLSVATEDLDATLVQLDDTMRRMVRLQLATGMRSSELCGLRWDLIDRSRKVWIYHPAEHKTEHWGHQRYIALRPIDQVNLFPILRTGYVFLTRAGKPYTRDTYRQNIKRAIARAGCRDWTPHQLRHSAITRWATTAGVDTARLLAGHASPEMTVRYIDHTADQVIKAAESLG